MIENEVRYRNAIRTTRELEMHSVPFISLVISVPTRRPPFSIPSDVIRSPTDGLNL